MTSLQRDYRASVAEDGIALKRNKTNRDYWYIFVLAWEHGTRKGCVLGLINTDADSGQRVVGAGGTWCVLPCACSFLCLSRSGLLAAAVRKRVLS